MGFLFDIQEPVGVSKKNKKKASAANAKSNESVAGNSIQLPLERLISHQLSLTSHPKNKLVAPLEKCESLRRDFHFLSSHGTRCVLQAKMMNWPSPHRRTRVSTFGLCPTAKDATSPSTSRSSPCVDTLMMSSASATTTTTTSWLLLVPKRSSNCGPPSPDKIFVTNQDGDLHFFSFSFSFSFLKFVSRLSLKTQKRRISIINVNLIILN